MNIVVNWKENKRPKNQKKKKKKKKTGKNIKTNMIKNCKEHP